jgi:hypothetical protein
VCELGIVMPQAANIGDRPLPMPSPPRKVDQGKEQSSEPLRRQSKEQSKQHQEQDGRSIFTNKHLLHSPSNEPRQPFARKTHLTGHRGHTTTAMSLVNLAHVCSHLQNISRPSRPHIDPPHSPPPLGRSPAPEARFLLPGQARRPITTRLLLPSRSPR